MEFLSFNIPGNFQLPWPKFEFVSPLPGQQAVWPVRAHFLWSTSLSGFSTNRASALDSRIQRRSYSLTSCHPVAPVHRPLACSRSTHKYVALYLPLVVFPNNRTVFPTSCLMSLNGTRSFHVFEVMEIENEQLNFLETSSLSDSWLIGNDNVFVKLYSVESPF